jgi:hypothetical protein
MKHRRDTRGWSVTSSDEGLDAVSSEITITVLDSSSPVPMPRTAKCHSIAVVPTRSTSPLPTPDATLLSPKTKSTPARKKGVAGALKSYAQRFQRRKSEADIKPKEPEEVTNENNNNINADMRRASSACDVSNR